LEEQVGVPSIYNLAFVHFKSSSVIGSVVSVVIFIMPDKNKLITIPIPIVKATNKITATKGLTPFLIKTNLDLNKFIGNSVMYEDFNSFRLSLWFFS
jgi:hypothetical protein